MCVGACMDLYVCGSGCVCDVYVSVLAPVYACVSACD